MFCQTVLFVRIDPHGLVVSQIDSGNNVMYSIERKFLVIFSHAFISLFHVGLCTNYF